MPNSACQLFHTALLMSWSHRLLIIHSPQLGLKEDLVAQSFRCVFLDLPVQSRRAIMVVVTKGDSADKTPPEPLQQQCEVHLGDYVVQTLVSPILGSEAQLWQTQPAFNFYTSFPHDDCLILWKLTYLCPCTLVLGHHLPVGPPLTMSSQRTSNHHLTSSHWFPYQSSVVSVLNCIWVLR
jgi:hypothetical protein